MKSRFVPGGGERLRESPEFQAQLQALDESVRERYAAQWAAAGFWRRLVLRRRMAAELRRARRKLEPSPRSLFGAVPER